MPRPSTSFPTPEAWLLHRVSYGETDAMAVVYYGNYFHWFERARNRYIRERGMSYRDIESRGIFLPVREAACRYFAPARYEDQVWVRAGISKWTKASMTFTYEITDHDRERVLSAGSTQHACVDGQGRPVRVPDWLRGMCDDSPAEPTP
ncbi:MAG: acyl-CoA thioesterase [Deltaproteobacteria bacterium]|nr:acyl-CoA thioesterase [Deltaproteobacteria bacterium]